MAHKADKAVDKTKIRIKEALNLFDPVIIFPYHGYANSTKAYINGRILEKERMIHEDNEVEGSLWNNIYKVWKRYESDEVPGVEIEGELYGLTAKTKSNEEGYFMLVFDLEGQQLKDGWHKVKLRITDMPYDLKYEEIAESAIQVCNQQNCFGIISDVDDTIIKSDAMHTIKKLRIMLTKDAKSRVAFDGVDHLYRNLTADGKNPLFFVSGSSYNLYDMLVSFCEHQSIPRAPFFLRNIGLDPTKWFKQDTDEYKKEHIEHLFEVFNNLSFICIGDSGQKDPEIYLDLYKKYPGRIKAIYIRHVHTDHRKQALKEMANSTDIPFLIMSDSKDALDHATAQSWV
ncbi:DUF2183 domain-containing protein [Fulvivirga ulvae]|uniref:phosphatase domain-containing protein n=1 Tax=Fulvivirga ulvae TaxID=2904245 RepID=UPI001F21E190|nr:phosphatase domain-containing protein [Fulvivirga ulvae]UII30551.1 DUF2183 domain-containing protein [Fulvivirga ulvae]